MKRRNSMKLSKFSKRFTAVAMSAIMSAAIYAEAAIPVSAAENLTPGITYTNGNYTFEKVSHPDSPTETADGIVDYIGNGSVTPYIKGETNGNGDRGQSYSYASAVYGDWVYINTMYGGLGVSAILQHGMSGLDPETAKAMMNVMYNGNLYMGEPDSAYAGGVLLKFNVKTGETKILMSRDVNNLIPTFRNACEINGKLYFVGMVVDTKRMTKQEVATAIAMQNGLPCIYEIDPENDDKLTCIYNCVDMDGYRKLVADNVFTSTRAIGTYKDSLIIGCLDTEGVFLCASKDPSAGQDSFSVIADMEDLFNYPAYHRSDVNGGGGIYQVIEYNNKLYVVLCTGTADSKNEETGTLQTFAIVRGECSGDVTDKNSWTWSVLAGDQNDGAKYPFGLDEERVSAGACTLEVYNGYLYIGDYNDVSSALQGFALRKDFKTQATNLEQSINLYRMDKDENIEMIVGDPTKRFPNGGISGLGSGYETHMSQYTWQTTVYEGKLYVSTMDTTTLLEPIAQFTNGDLLKMSSEEWESQINYIRVLLELLLGSDEEAPAINLYSANELKIGINNDIMPKNLTLAKIEEAVKKASLRAAEASSSTMNMFSADDTQTAISITLTEEQKKALVAGLLDGSIMEGQIHTGQIDELARLNNALNSISELIETTEIEDFSDIYSTLVEYYQNQSYELPEKVKALYEMLLSVATEDNLVSLAKSLKYLRTSEAGFDLYEIQQNEDGTVTINSITTNGFGDRFNHGLRIFAKTTDYLLIGTANPFYGTQLWRRKNTEQKPSDEGEKPSDEGEKPSDEGGKPSDEGGKPSDESGKPADEGGKPADESSKPTEKSDISDSSNPDGSTKSSVSNSTINTGDHSNTVIWICMIGASAAALSMALLKRKKNIS